MATNASRPRLRPVETIIVPDEKLGKSLMLRDTQGIAPGHVTLPMGLVAIAARMNGRLSCDEIARAVSKELGDQVPVALVVQLATELEDALFAFGAPYEQARARIEKEFADDDIRRATHAGGAYYGDPKKLAAYIDRECLGAASKVDGDTGRLRALVAPHIDPWRGARCYGEAYGLLSRHLPKDVETFVLLGTSHAPMDQPFALCRKSFETPLGLVPPNKEAIDALAKAADFDPYADQFNHKKEHSLEFQVVFLKHLLGERPFRIVPILCGLGEQQSTGRSPAGSAAATKFLDAIRAVAENAVVIAGADLAHIGPRFGDPEPLDAGERSALDDTDRASLDFAAGVDAEGFWRHVSADLDTRRVCGLAPIYSLLRTVAPGLEGRVRHYEQNVDPEEGSIVSHAAIGFYG